MDQRYEIRPGYTISRVINGCWQLSLGHNLQGELDFADIMCGFHALVERGFTTFDCADIYTGAEEFIGEFVEELRRRGDYHPNDIQVHTKYVPDIATLDKVDFQSTEAVIDRSLQRLHRDTLDAVQFHWWDYEVPGCLETAGYLKRLQEKGKIRNISMCNFDTRHLAEIVEAGIPVMSTQAQYSFFDRRPEKGLLQYCKEHDIALFCYGTLSGGFLSEKWIGRDYKAPETRSQIKYMQVIEDTMGWQGYQELLLLLKGIADRHGVSISNVAVRYILDQPGVGAAIVGVRNSRHVEDNVNVFRFSLEESERAALRAYMDRFPILDGEPFEMERTPGSKYRAIMHMNINEEEQK